MKTSETIGALVSALCAAQAAIPTVPKDREVEVFSKKTNKKYRFKYATFDAITNAIKRPLGDNSLCYVQILSINAGQRSLITRLMHGSGEWIESEMLLTAEGGGNQELGSAITYAKRYSLAAMLGISADDDDDGNAGDGNAITDSRERSSRPADPTSNPGTSTPISVQVPSSPGPIRVSGDGRSPDDLWLAFSAALKDCYRNAKTEGELNAWVDRNREFLDDLAKHHPGYSKRLFDIEVDCRTQLANPGAG